MSIISRIKEEEICYKLRIFDVRKISDTKY